MTYYFLVSNTSCSDEREIIRYDIIPNLREELSLKDEELTVIDLGTPLIQGYSKKLIRLAITEIRKLNPHYIILSDGDYKTTDELINMFGQRASSVTIISNKNMDKYGENYLSLNNWNAITARLLQKSKKSTIKADIYTGYADIFNDYGHYANQAINKFMEVIYGENHGYFPEEITRRTTDLCDIIYFIGIISKVFNNTEMANNAISCLEKLIRILNVYSDYLNKDYYTFRHKILNFIANEENSEIIFEKSVRYPSEIMALALASEIRENDVDIIKPVNDYFKDYFKTFHVAFRGWLNFACSQFQINNKERKNFFKLAERYNYELPGANDLWLGSALEFKNDRLELMEKIDLIGHYLCESIDSERVVTFLRLVYSFKSFALAYAYKNGFSNTAAFITNNGDEAQTELQTLFFMYRYSREDYENAMATINVATLNKNYIKLKAIVRNIEYEMIESFREEYEELIAFGKNYHFLVRRRV